MNAITRRGLGGIVAGAALAARGAAAQSWPSRPVTVVVPFPAGGSTDVLARGLARHLAETIGRPFVVDNRTGAGGNIGAGSVARAAPDGHTLLVSTNGPLTTNTLLYRNMTYDPARDFSPVAPAAELPVLFAARPGLPYASIAELVAHARANPGGVNCGVPGTGLQGHLAAELLQHRTGARFTIVPYRGSAPLTNDLLAGAVDVAVDFVTTYLPHMQAGTVRPLGVTSARRLPTLPDVPTVAEQGVPDFKATGWVALYAPARTPPEIVERLAAATNAYLALDATKGLLPTLGMAPIGGTPADVSRMMREEVALWGPVVREARITLE